MAADGYQYQVLQYIWDLEGTQTSYMRVIDINITARGNGLGERGFQLHFVLWRTSVIAVVAIDGKDVIIVIVRGGTECCLIGGLT